MDEVLHALRTELALPDTAVVTMILVRMLRKGVRDNFLQEMGSRSFVPSLVA